MKDMLNKEIVELEVKLERRRETVAQNYVKRLAPIITVFGIYQTANTYRPRTTLWEHLQFIYRPSAFLIEKRPFSGKWFQTGNLMIGKHRYHNQKGWYGAEFRDYHVYEDHKEILCVREILCSDGWLVYRMKHLGHITPDIIQHLLRLNAQATQEYRKQREPEIQEPKEQLKRLAIADIECN